MPARDYCAYRQWAVDNGVEETRDSMWRAFINRVRDNLHVVLAMSPIGEAFRARYGLG
jgi:dynein heavy chain